MDPIEQLMNEHRVIERTLEPFERLGREVSAGRGSPERLAQFVEFYREFADACHHGKEEGILFEAMAEAGFSRDRGPLAVMFAEHGAMRQCIYDLHRLQERTSWTRDDREHIAEAIALYVELLSEHIRKEDQVLYPMARERLSDETFERMQAAFETFEAEETGEGEHERLHALAHALIEPSAAA